MVFRESFFKARYYWGGSPLMEIGIYVYWRADGNPLKFELLVCASRASFCRVLFYSSHLVCAQLPNGGTILKLE
jgi:hypothetical protein